MNKNLSHFLLVFLIFFLGLEALARIGPNQAIFFFCDPYTSKVPILESAPLTILIGATCMVLVTKSNTCLGLATGTKRVLCSSDSYAYKIKSAIISGSGSKHIPNCDNSPPENRLMFDREQSLESNKWLALYTTHIFTSMIIRISIN